jgi:glycosyltransferase involved in cell wall biosynthesis
MNLSKLSVSCIITTKNRPDLVLVAIQSVLQQTHNRIKLIVIDDSDDNITEKMIRNKDLPLKYIKNDQSRGAQYSRNIGLSEVDGDCVAFLDDDDYWYPRKIKEQIQHLSSFPLVTCNSKSKLNEHHTLYSYRPPQISYNELLYTNLVGSCSFPLIDASLIRDVYFDESLTSSQDWDYWLSVMKKNGITSVKTIEDVLVNYNLGAHQRISNANTQSLLLGKFIIYNKYFEDFVSYSDLNKIISSMIRIESNSRVSKLIGLASNAYHKKKLKLLAKTLIHTKLSNNNYQYLF